MAGTWEGTGEEESGIHPDFQQVERLCGAMIELDVTAEVWAEAARLGGKCREHGRPVPASDLVIAACAHVHRVRIEAEDAHFRLLETFRPS